MRKILISLIGVLILAASVGIFKIMTKEKDAPKPKDLKIVQSVMAQKIENKTLPLEVSASGKLSAKNILDIYAESQGVFEKTYKDFKPGVKYNKGEILVKINSDEFRASLKAKKSSLYNTISAIMPDLKLDFPESFPQWQSYLNSFDVNTNLHELPTFLSEKEKYFIAAKNISVLYYDIKNLEEKLSKYNIYAPYSGVLTEALVNNGTLVRAGQKLGQFIDPSAYELEISLSETLASFLNEGNKVQVENLEGTKQWTGTIVRKNAVIEQTSQTKKVYIKLSGSDLSDGMYLRAFINGKQQENVVELNRSLIVNDNSVYIISKENTLELKQITVIHSNQGTAIVAGLENGELIISKVVPGAYDGMPVKIIDEGK